MLLGNRNLNPGKADGILGRHTYVLQEEKLMNTNTRIGLLTVATIIGCFLASCTSPTSYDVILRSGTIYDGSGEKPYTGDVALSGDKIPH